MENSALPPGRRCFYSLPTSCPKSNGITDSIRTNNALENQNASILSYIGSNVVGKDAIFSGPFGLRKVVYCDNVASAKPLNCIEDYIRNHVLTLYGSTHTTTSVTSLQSTLFMHEARDIVRSAVRANEHNAVIFTGNGVTGAVHKLIHAMKFSKPPVVLVGPFEHHSNLLPWREVSAYIINIGQNANGDVDMKHLEAALQNWQNIGLPIIGCFSAASNVTGQLSNTISISKMLHSYGALAFWDYATAGPYIDIDMNPLTKDGLNASKDAVFLSMHKFPGGVDSPGILIASRKLFENKVPLVRGGGSVFFVTNEDHRYLQDEETREEAGTPNIVGSIRAGLAFKLKQDIGSNVIMKRQSEIYYKVFAKWKTVKNLKILGNYDLENDTKKEHSKLAIFSFMILHPESNFYLHHNYVATLLNDLFDIQARGGCACAGPYAQDLLGIEFDVAKEIETVLLEDSRLDRSHLRRRREYSQLEILRPGFVRLNFAYYMSEEEVDFIIEAVSLVASEGWKLLPQYMFNPETGEWRHTKHQVFTDRKWLGHIKFGANGLEFKEPTLTTKKGELPQSHSECLENSRSVFQACNKAVPLKLVDHRTLFPSEVSHLRWFLTPYEAQLFIKPTRLIEPMHKLPFTVKTKVHLLSQDELAASVQIPDYVKNIVHESAEKTPPAPTKSSPLKTTKGIPSKAVVSQQGSDKCVLKHVQISNAAVQFISPPKHLFKQTIKAIKEFNMIRNGDKVLVCLSGGKDSLSLLHTLRQYQFYAKKKQIEFELGAVTVDPKTKSYDPSPLIKYLAKLGLTYFYEEQAIFDQALALPELTSICAFCSRMKRGRLYACARREKWNVLAMGQHLDDLAESFLMSTFQNGVLRTMKANYSVKEGDLRIIRPFVYVREKETRDFAERSQFPVIPENCPACFEAPKERHRMKQLLAAQEILHPKLFYSLKEALLPLMAKNQTGMESNMSNLYLDSSQADQLDEDYD